MICMWKFTKGHNSIKKSVGGVMVPVLCTLSDYALFFIQVLCKYLKGV